MEALVLAGGLAAGMDWRLSGLVAGAIWAPRPSILALTAVLIVGQRARGRSRDLTDIAFAEVVIAELRAGSSLRAALRLACDDRPEAGAIRRRLDTGEPLGQAVRGLGAIVPSIGPLVETAVLVGGGGGRMLPVFEELLVHATAEQEAAAELSTALAPVRASMSVLVGAPVSYLVWSGLTGRLARLLSLPGGLWISVVGWFLFAAGITVMILLTKLGRR
ncbi:MAG TPA: type II secretion system F family protein [Acidimicrobiia bacterium]|nr:type II secretion system F family protein [Acidimicrobiia bacterium]